MNNSMAAKEVMVRHQDLSVAWMDYQKVYNRVLHEWISMMLSFIKAPFLVQYTLWNLQEKSSVWERGSLQ